MAKFDPDHAVVPPTNFGYKNSAEKFLECGKFRKCANLRLIPAQLQLVRLHIPVCMESRFNRTGTAEWLPMPVFGQPLSPLTYTTVGEWAPHISCPVKCKGHRNPRWAKFPGFAIGVIWSLALGIAATTTIFSLVYGVLLDPFPYKDSKDICKLQILTSSGHYQPLLVNGNHSTELRSVSAVRDVLFQQPSQSKNLTAESSVTGPRYGIRMLSMIGSASLRISSS
jgi:hypothetical protein